MPHAPADLDIDFDPALAEGARNAIFTCLGVKPGERCLLVTDRDNLPIAAALASEFRRAGGGLQAFILEDLAARPLIALPPAIAAALEETEVSCYAASAEEGELAVRIAFTAIVNRRKIRHAHMVNITPRIMREGMRADFRLVDALSRWVLERVREAREITATSAAGSRLRATFDPSIRWLKTSGIISPDKWGNLPGGEVLTSPARLDGVYVCDGVLGDWLAKKYGDMREHPLTITIDNSRIVDLECERADILKDFQAYTQQHPNSNRVGELAVGTNIALTDVIGQILQDEKLPGLHIAFGHPYSEHTGAPWMAPSHIDVVGRAFDVAVDGEPIMRESRYLIDPAALPQ